MRGISGIAVVGIVVVGSLMGGALPASAAPVTVTDRRFYLAVCVQVTGSSWTP